MKYVAVLGLFLFTLFGFAQKQVKKTLINLESKSIQIDANNCYTVDLATVRGNEILVEAFIDGEYQKDLIVKIQEEGSNVLISAGFQPNFVNPNDKLSAHKIISIELRISVPEQTTVQLFGTRSYVSVRGLYRKLKVDLADGRCTLLNTGEDVAVKTQNGDIFLETHSGSINATSKYGKVKSEDLPEGDYQYTLHSVEGNIHVSKIE